MYLGTLTRQNTITPKKKIAIRIPSAQDQSREIDVENVGLALSPKLNMRDSPFHIVRLMRSPYALSATIQHSNRSNQTMRPAFTAKTKSAVKAGRIPKVKQILCGDRRYVCRYHHTRSHNLLAFLLLRLIMRLQLQEATPYLQLLRSSHLRLAQMSIRIVSL